MKKKIVALFAAIAAVLGFGFAANTAMADEYGSTGEINGNVVAFSLEGFTPGETVVVTYDDTYVAAAQVVTVANKTAEGTAGKTGKVQVNYTLKAGTPAGTVITATAKGQESGHVATASVTVKTAVGEGTGSASEGTGSASNELGNTGASIAPYALAVVLLAAAGFSVFAARKASAR